MSSVFPTPLPPDLEYACNSEYSQEYGADIDELSVTAVTGEEVSTTRNGDLLLPDGYDRLLAEVRGDIEVRTDAIVTTITYSDDAATLTLASGETLTADHVVVTVPVGVLKAGSINFDPALPPDKQDAIDAIGAGLLDKVWLEFPYVFWNPDVDVIAWFDHDTPGRWSTWVNGHKVFGKPVLLGLNGGRRARELAHFSDREIVFSAMDALRRMHA